jgi:hypothetical protein
LHHVRAQALGGDLTRIAWNHAAADPFMFATGSHDGAVRVWTKPLDDLSSGKCPPRTSSPFELDGVDRTDSPTQQDFESQNTHTSSMGESTGPLLRERTVAFVTGPSI